MSRGLSFRFPSRAFNTVLCQILLSLLFCYPGSLSDFSIGASEALAAAPEVDKTNNEDSEPEKDKEAARQDSKGQVESAKKGDAEQDASSADDNEAEDKPEEPSAADKAEAKAWEAVWAGQRQMLNEIRETAIGLSDSFAKQTQDLSQRLNPFDDEARRLLVFATTFRVSPNAMEAVARRMGAIITDIQQVIKPVSQARSEAEGLLERVNHMAQSLPEDINTNLLSDEMRDFMDGITRARLRLTAVVAQYNSLLPSLALVDRLQKQRDDILARLPRLWEQFYTQAPLAWLDPDIWVNVKRDMEYAWQSLILRLPVEMPSRPPLWGMAAMRFCIGLIFSGVLCLILRNRLLKPDSSEAVKHVFRVSLPWLILGFALASSSVSAAGDFYRLFLALGAGCMLLSQVYLSWDLRCLQYPEAEEQWRPLMRLMPLAFTAYLLLYAPLAQVVALIIWTVLLICALLRRRGFRKPDFGPANLEETALDCEGFILWLSLFLAITGMRVYSMLAYLGYVALFLTCQMSVAGVSLVGKINERLPEEGARAALARVVVALAAPFALAAAFAGVCLWVAMLPGGTWLLAEYAFKNVSLGDTQINIIQALLIISAFYIARSIVAMGTRFLTRLPEEGVNFDPTLITPLQTFLTYATWALFALFALRSLGMDFKNLAMVAGGLSVGIGLGMQNLVNNFISGLVLIFGRALQVGDVVEVGGYTGRVRKISVRATMVETYDNAVIYVPNSEFMAGRLINWTSFSRSVRRVVKIGVAYGADTETVIKTLISIAKAHDNVLKFPAPSVNFANFGDSSLDFDLRFWVKDYDLGAVTMSDIRLAINKKFAEMGINIPFPQLDAHISGAVAKDARISAPQKKRRVPMSAPRLPKTHRQTKTVGARQARALINLQETQTK